MKSRRFQRASLKFDAAEAGFRIDHTPQAGDLVVLPDSAMMGTDASGNSWTASAGGHVAFVVAVDSASTITISEMGVDTDPVGGFTMVQTFNPTTSSFVHQ